MVFVTSERSKSKARDSYFVLRLDDKNRMAIIQKFPMSHFKHHHINVQYQLFYKLSSSPPALALSPSTSSPVLIPKITPPKPKSKFCFTLPPSYSPESDSDEKDYDLVPPHAQPVSQFPIPPHDDDLFNAALPALDLHEVHVEPHPQPLHHVLHDAHPSLQLTQPVYGQKDYLKAGDMIVLVQAKVWCKVVLSSHYGHSDAQNGSLYWNYAAVDGSNTR